MHSSSHQLSFRLLQRCPSCKARTPYTSVSIIAETANTVIAHLNCNACHINYIAFISHTEQGITGNIVLTDLDFAEIQKYVDTAPINENEFLALYEKIRKPEFINKLSLQ